MDTQRIVQLKGPETFEELAVPSHLCCQQPATLPFSKELDVLCTFLLVPALFCFVFLDSELSRVGIMSTSYLCKPYPGSSSAP